VKQLLPALLAVVVAPAAAAAYVLDPTHTSVHFALPHFNTSVLRGRFERKQGSIEFDRAARTGHVDIAVEIASVDTGVAALDAHLQGRQVFDGARFPTARFVGEHFVFSGDRVDAVAGRLTLHGQTHALTLKARRFNCYTSPLFLREVCGGDFEATLQRSLWGIDDGLPAIAPDSVQLLIQVEAIRQ